MKTQFHIESFDDVSEALQAVVDRMTEISKVSRETTQLMFEGVKKMSERIKNLEEKK